MPKIKTFGVGNNGFINPAIRDALELPRHITQADIVVAAPSKAEAHRMLAGLLRIRISASDPDFRQVAGSFVDALRDADLLRTPAVFATSNIYSDGSRVVAILPDGVPEVIGRLVREDRFVFRSDVPFDDED